MLSSRACILKRKIYSLQRRAENSEEDTEEMSYMPAKHVSDMFCIVIYDVTSSRQVHHMKKYYMRIQKIISVL